MNVPEMKEARPLNRTLTRRAPTGPDDCQTGQNAVPSFKHAVQIPYHGEEAPWMPVCHIATSNSS